MSRYQILIADPLLGLGMEWPDGVSLVRQLDEIAPAGMHWHLLDDPGAPDGLEGKQAEITVRRADGEPAITSRRVILTHQVPDGDEDVLPCCGITVTDLPLKDHLARNPDLVTCGGAP